MKRAAIVAAVLLGVGVAVAQADPLIVAYNAWISYAGLHQCVGAPVSETLTCRRKSDNAKFRLEGVRKSRVKACAWATINDGPQPAPYTFRCNLNATPWCTLLGGIHYGCE